MGILDICIHAAVGLGGVLTGVKHGKALYNEAKTRLNEKKQANVEEQEAQEETEEQ